ncbi:MAG: TolC family protein [Candidatus Omnitrophica bacterium]|nr:TolC family protein [Candidatus Omnitrophota bacterium]
MKYLTVLFVGMLISCGNFALYGQEAMNSGMIDVKKIDAGAAAKMTVETSEMVKQSGNNIKISEEIINETAASSRPQMEGSATWTNYTRYPVNSRFERGAIGDYRADMTAEVSQVLWAFGRISNAIAAAKEGASASEYMDEANRLDAEYTGKMAFYHLVYADNVHVIAQESYNNSVETKKIIEERSEGGRVSRKDNIDIESDIASRATLVNDSRSNMKIAENSFKRLSGLGIKDKVYPVMNEDEVFSEIDPDAMINMLFENEPTLKALDSQLKASGRTVKASFAEYFPTVAAFGNWTYSGHSDSRKVPYINNKDQMDQIGLMGVKVTLPVWEGGARGAKLEQAKLKEKNARLSLEKAKKDLELELYNAVSEYNESIDTLKANDKAVDLAGQTFMLFKELVSSGQISLLELSDAELMLANEKLKKEGTLYGIRASKAKIDRLVNARM